MFGKFFSDTNARVDRRTFMRVSGSLFAGLMGLGRLAPAVFGTSSSQSQRVNLPVIVLFNSGGPSQKETFNPDPPGTPVELRGSLGTVATSVTGVHFSENWPQLAVRAHRFSLLRAIHSGSSDHFASARNLLRPNNTSTFGIRWGERAADGGVPYMFIETPSQYQPMDALETSRSLHIKWRRSSEPEGTFNSDWERDLAAPGDFAAPEFRSDPRLQERVNLLRGLEQHATPIESEAAQRRDRCYELALSLMLGGGTFFEAFTPPAGERTQFERDLVRYGTRSKVGRGLLLARRLAERGAGVSVVYNELGMGWDMHSQLAERIRPLATETDVAASALLDDITAGRFNGVFVMIGEFGRTPRVNGSAGRDHWAEGFPGIFAGGRFRQGTVHGATSALGVIRSGRVPTQDVVSTIIAAAGGELMPTVPRVREILS